MDSKCFTIFLVVVAAVFIANIECNPVGHEINSAEAMTATNNMAPMTEGQRQGRFYGWGYPGYPGYGVPYGGGYGGSAAAAAAAASSSSSGGGMGYPYGRK